jgi:Ser/Thr protein kinase RdoA (MazF antagonist)
LENESLKLLTPVGEKRLSAWLEEFYGKPVNLSSRKVLQHRDLSYVERLFIEDGLPETLIYKLVLPPFDIEWELHQRILVPSITNSAQLYLTAHSGEMTAMFMEDLGSHSLKSDATPEHAVSVGRELAKIHRAYSYRTDELMQVNILPTRFPIDYEEFAATLAEKLKQWHLIKVAQSGMLAVLANTLAAHLAGESTSLVHGDMCADNLILRHNRLFVIDWSFFTHLGVPTMDLATVTMDNNKNGPFAKLKETVIDAYSFESGRDVADVQAVLPFAETLSRLFFLGWLAERRGRGIMGTTVGPVEELIPKVLEELANRLKKLPD